jgi:hypothetical protein
MRVFPWHPKSTEIKEAERLVVLLLEVEAALSRHVAGNPTGTTSLSKYNWISFFALENGNHYKPIPSGRGVLSTASETMKRRQGPTQ